jgi:hypothetical protein
MAGHRATPLSYLLPNQYHALGAVRGNFLLLQKQAGRDAGRTINLHDV